MKQGTLLKILKAAKRLKIGVIGDFCLDAYWTVDESLAERSVETGLVTRPICSQRYAPGGAGGVVGNLRAYGTGKVEAFGVVGTDPFGVHLRMLLAEMKAGTDGLIVQAAGWNTHVYAKPQHNGEEEGRIDFGVHNRLGEACADELLAALEKRLPDLDAVIVNEQIRWGIHGSLYFRRKLAALIKAHPEKIFVLDSRHLGNAYPGAVIKMNGHEALALSGVEHDPAERVSRQEAWSAAKALYRRRKRLVVITRGDRGCLVCDGDGVKEVPGLLILKPVDIVGAGDSLLSGLAVGLGAGCDPVVAAEFGGFVAGVTVQKLKQTGVASAEELIEIGSDPDYVFNPDLADAPQKAVFFKDTEIESVNGIPKGFSPTHAIFDHDGTISTLREGWEGVMLPIMVKAVLGPRYADAEEALFRKVEEAARILIDKTTGIQTIAQMRQMTELVRSFGCVPEKEILTAEGYKRMYLEALMERVRAREEKFRRGELAIEDVTMKGAVSFLKALKAAGVKLYLASGTDRADVVAEAKALGYADLFEGGIYGAEPGVETEAKKRVFQQILSGIGSGGRILALGDGMVEMREAKKVGGVAVGVASDEPRRFGWNLSKRARVIRGGADVVIPDFSQGAALLALMGVKK